MKDFEVVGGDGPIPRPRIPEPEQTRKGMMVLRSYDKVLAGQSCYIVARPQITAYRVVRIAIPDDIADAFNIDDMRVGNRSQMVQAGSFRASYFAAHIDGLAKLTAKMVQNETIKIDISEPAEAEFGRDFPFDTCQVAMDFGFCVTNVSGVAQRFEAWCLGIGVW